MNQFSPRFPGSPVIGGQGLRMPRPSVVLRSSPTDHLVVVRPHEQPGYDTGDHHRDDFRTRSLRSRGRPVEQDPYPTSQQQQRESAEDQHSFSQLQHPRQPQEESAEKQSGVNHQQQGEPAEEQRDVNHHQHSRQQQDGSAGFQHGVNHHQDPQQQQDGSAGFQRGVNHQQRPWQQHPRQQQGEPAEEQRAINHHHQQQHTQQQQGEPTRKQPCESLDDFTSLCAEVRMLSENLKLSRHVEPATQGYNPLYIYMTERHIVGDVPPHQGQAPVNVGPDAKLAASFNVVERPRGRYVSQQGHKVHAPTKAGPNYGHPFSCSMVEGPRPYPELEHMLPQGHQETRAGPGYDHFFSRGTAEGPGPYPELGLKLPQGYQDYGYPRAGPPVNAPIRTDQFTRIDSNDMVGSLERFIQELDLHGVYSDREKMRTAYLVFPRATVNIFMSTDLPKTFTVFEEYIKDTTPRVYACHRQMVWARTPDPAELEEAAIKASSCPRDEIKKHFVWFNAPKWAQGAIRDSFNLAYREFRARVALILSGGNSERDRPHPRAKAWEATQAQQDAGGKSLCRFHVRYGSSAYNCSGPSCRAFPPTGTPPKVASN